ncbi:hypothetical protein C3492_05440 [Streptomyces sp. Ru62]|uniref:hypothetical protein n=1 Tax=Streptomyces sp. Ru62 TaxID=2080745 RepID=UPI000CDDF55F|nr:hypothetical protein [Streptomyces sp. Ru62]POX64477.1 hypothetical protein C3492_05440 [Streptomyces sp. Ru62]
MSTDVSPHEATVTCWGPVSWELRTPDAGECRWFTEHLSVTHSRLSPPLVPRRHFRVEVRPGPLPGRGTAEPGQPVVRIRDESYRRSVLGGLPAWTWEERADTALPPHAFVRRGDDDWLVLRARSGGPDRRTGREDGRHRPAEILAREFLTGVLSARGGLTVHASAAYWTGGPGIGGSHPPGITLFCGASGAGKSTLALALATAGGSFVAGDRCVLLPGRDRWDVVGAAVAARFGWGTLAGTGRAGLVRATPLLRHGGTPVGSLPHPRPRHC